MDRNPSVGFRKNSALRFNEEEKYLRESYWTSSPRMEYSKTFWKPMNENAPKTFKT